MNSMQPRDSADRVDGLFLTLMWPQERPADSLSDGMFDICSVEVESCGPEQLHNSGIGIKP